MKSAAALCPLIICAFAAPTWAAPCVGTTFDHPLDGALDVQSFVADVPSAQYPAFWQKGTLGNYTYVIYANGEGTLRSRNPFEDWGVTVQCDTTTNTCDTSTEGTPPQDATAISNQLSACLLGETSAPVEPDPTPDAQPAPQPDPAEQQTAQCGLATITEDSDIATLQRLLVLAGKNPGPVDGFLGAQTFQALDGIIDNAGWDMSVPDAIARVDAVLCKPDS